MFSLTVTKFQQFRDRKNNIKPHREESIISPYLFNIWKDIVKGLLPSTTCGCVTAMLQVSSTSLWTWGTKSASLWSAYSTVVMIFWLWTTAWYCFVTERNYFGAFRNDPYFISDVTYLHPNSDHDTNRPNPIDVRSDSPQDCVCRRVDTEKGQLKDTWIPHSMDGIWTVDAPISKAAQSVLGKKKDSPNSCRWDHNETSPGCLQKSSFINMDGYRGRISKLRTQVDDSSRFWPISSQGT